MVHVEALRVLRQAVLAVSAAGVALAANSEAEDLIKRVIAKVAANDSSIHNYVCAETIQREFYKPRGATLPRACPVLMELRQHPTWDMVLHLASTDRLRLEVATTERGEIFSWVGASRFDEAGIEDLVRNGPIGTGSFGAFLSVIFLHDAKNFVFTGETVVNGRRLLDYSFEVAQPDSHYRIKLVEGQGWTMSAYSGSVLVDPATADPVRLTLQTAELPSAAGSCQSMGTLDYSQVRVGDKDLLLPARARQRFIALNGQETENTTSFSNCREYSSESTVTFFPDTEAKTGSTAPGPSAIPARIPEALPFAFELTAPIDSDTAAAGDRFTGKLTDALRDGKRVLAPKGSKVEGRISVVAVYFRPASEVMLGLTPEALEIRGTKVPLAAIPDTRGFVRAHPPQRGKGVQIYLPLPGERSGVFVRPGVHAVFGRGFVSEWKTAAPH